ADEQRTQPCPALLRIREAADEKLRRQLALHLEPALRAAVLVRRVEPLRDHALPALRTRLLPRPRSVHALHAAEWWLERQRVQHLISLYERQQCDVSTVQPQHVEHVIRDRTPLIPR